MEFDIDKVNYESWPAVSKAALNIMDEWIYEIIPPATRVQMLKELDQLMFKFEEHILLRPTES